jgi:hypothetical protein
MAITVRSVFALEGGTARGDFEPWVATSPVIEFTL